MATKRDCIGTIGAVAAAAALAACARAGTGGDDDDDVALPDASAGADAPVSSRIDAGGGNMCTRTPCDLYPQCGCTPPQVCDLNLSTIGDTQCRNVTTPGMDGDACTSLGQCAGGYVCVNSNCSPYCNVDLDCGDVRRKCVIELALGTEPIPGATVCSSACNPANVASTGLCPAGYSCHLSFLDPDGVSMSGDENPFAICGMAGTVTQGMACSANTDCALDHLCINTGTTVCAHMCTVSPPGGECPGGTTCGGLNPQMLIGGTEYGACL